MNNYISKALAPLLFAFSISANAQSNLPVKNPPITMETMVGDRGLAYQTIISKKFQSAPRFGFFSVNSFVAEWDTKKVDDLMLQGHLTYDLTKGFSINAGFHYVHATGVRPTLSMLYTYANPTWLVVAFPRVDLVSKPNVELFSLVEYKPKINENWKFYSRLQAMYVHNPSEETHQKSGLALRAGVTFKEFTFGAGYNFDSYGPMKHEMHNIGGFVSVLLF